MITVGRLISKEAICYPIDNDSDPNVMLLHMAKTRDVNLFLFEPADVDFAQKTIHGQFLENNELVRRTVPIPPLVDNHYTLLDEELGPHTALARVWPGDTKYTTYADLKKAGVFGDILIPTFQLGSFDELKTHIEAFGEVVVKPALGAAGIGVVYLAKDGAGYRMNEHGTLKQMTAPEVAAYYDSHLAEDMIVQQYVDCRTLDGAPFDFRVWAVDRGGNDWTARPYPRIGGKAGILSNVSTGGYAMGIGEFLKREFGGQWESIYRHLQRLGRELPAHYAKLIGREIFDLGLDIGISRTAGGLKYWMFEANSMPRPYDHFLGGNLGLNLLEAYLSYYHYLYKKWSLGGRKG